MEIEPKLPHNILSMRIRMNCPHCSAYTKITLLVYSSTDSCRHLGMNKVGSIFYCESCLEPIFICWQLKDKKHSPPIVDQPQLMHISMPKSDLTYVQDKVKKEYIEALKCYGITCYNAFAAICRRTIQTICMDKEIAGTTKVMKQVEKLKKELADPEMSDILDELIISGHNGVHPHLPEVKEERAEKMLALMNDLLDQIYNRPGRLKVMKKLRQKAINKVKKKTTENNTIV